MTKSTTSQTITPETDALARAARPFAKYLKDIPTTEELTAPGSSYSNTSSSVRLAAMRWAAMQVNYKAEDLEKWGTEFAANPVYAFEWSDSMMEAAAAMKVYAEVFMAIQKVGLAEALERNTRELMIQARCASSSTSQASNSMARYDLSAIAQANESLRGFVAHAQEEEAKTSS